MTYIYVKKIKNKKYYYLRLDKRIKNKKIVKDIAYLGNDISKINIENLLNNKKYSKEIKKSYKDINKFLKLNYYKKKAEQKKFKKNKNLTKNQQIQLESINIHFNKRFKQLDKITQNDFFSNFIVSYVYNTTSIEGNTIPLKDVRKILSEEKISLKNKTLREIYDLRNSQDAFFFALNNLKKRLTEKLIIDTHKQLMKDIDKRTGYRNFDVRVIKANFDSTPYFRIEKEIHELIEWFNNSKQDIFIKTVMFHHQFEKIHPFADGNGRTGRMILNFLLLKNNYPPIIIRKKNKKEYFNVLSIADKKKDYIPLIKFILKEYDENYWNHFVC